MVKWIKIEFATKLLFLALHNLYVNTILHIAWINGKQNEQRGRLHYKVNVRNVQKNEQHRFRRKFERNVNRVSHVDAGGGGIGAGCGCEEALWSHLACWRGARAPPRGSCPWPWRRRGAFGGAEVSCLPGGTVSRFNRAGRRGAPWRPTGPRLLDWQRHLRLRSIRRRRCQPST